jgi:hypothetical protein
VRQGRFTISTKVKAKAHGDAGSPWLSLKVGNEWHYTLTTTTQTDGTRYFVIFESRSDKETKTRGVVVAIESAPPRDGWREVTLVVRSEQGDALGKHVLRPIDDETYYYDPPSSGASAGTDPPDEPDHTDPKSPLRVLLDVDPGTAPERGCRLADMGAGRCQQGGAPEDELPPAEEPAATAGAGAKSAAAKKPPVPRPGAKKGAPPPVVVRVPTRYALAGPSHLSTHWESRGGAATWIVAFLTGFIVIPQGMSGGEEYVLVRTVRAR